MGGYGWHNGFPFEYGGGETVDEEVYNALRSAVGKGGSAADDSGIDGLWRQCRAQTIATLMTFAERAALQAFPNLATDHIPVYEELLHITPAAGASDEERRRDITAAWTRQISADIPTLRTQLQLIDPRADILDLPHSRATTVVKGKGFEPQDGNPDYGGGRISSSYPNYASEYYLPILLDLAGAGPVPSAAVQIIIQRLKRLVRDVRPSWVDFAVMTGSGFILDLSPLDATGMT